MKKRAFFLLFSLCFSLFFLFSHEEQLKNAFRLGSSSVPCQVIIDIGHGGLDPGKVGINGSLEKDINLSIGLALKEYLLSAGYSCQVTRSSDSSLADKDASNQKLSDLKNRVSFINQYNPAAVISIHQNSYPEESVKGTQVFYDSDAGSKRLASCIQQQCKRILNPNNHRKIKESDDYYLFSHTTSPIVIVECGFLSNREEASLLITEDYQHQAAWAIFMGTVQYLKELE